MRLPILAVLLLAPLEALATPTPINGSLNGVTTNPTSVGYVRKLTAYPCSSAGSVVMRGFNGATPVFWPSCGADLTASGSGFGFGVLTGITQFR